MCGLKHQGDGMTSPRHSAVIFLIILLIVFSVAFPHNGMDLIGNRTRREIKCGELEHKDKDICCRLCPAGTRLVASCSKNGEVGTCVECDSGTYMDHPNYERKCLSCTKCPEDQEPVKQCTHTQNAVCQCKPGGFCSADHPCEVCRTCHKCSPGETVAQNCTAISNTECKPSSHPSDSSSVEEKLRTPGLEINKDALSSLNGSHETPKQHFPVVVGVVVPLVLLLLFAVGFGLYLKKKKGTCDSPGLQVKHDPEYDGLTGVSFAGTNKECRALCESSDSSRRSSEHSLIAPPYHSTPAPPSRQPPIQVLPNRTESAWSGVKTTHMPEAAYDINQRYEEFPQLIPTNGHESLRKCFEYFEDLDVHYYNRFFDRLDVNRNVIRSTAALHYTERMHAGLNDWLEKQGRNANLNNLLQVLLDLHQRQTAETIKAQALSSGHYLVEAP